MARPDESVRAYLLGLLPEDQVEAVEDAYFADPEEFDRVRAVENDLLDDYAAGRLEAQEKAAFERRYLASGPLRERVVAARALRLAPRAEAAGRAPTRSALRDRMSLLAVAAGFMAVFGWAMFWTWRTTRLVPPGPPPSLARTSPTPVPTPSLAPSPTASGSPSASPISPATSRLVFALSPTLLRGEGGPAVLAVPLGAAMIVLQLEGDPATLPGRPALRASVETVEGAHAWSGPARGAPAGTRPSVVAVAEIPAADLPPGDYLLTLRAGDEVLNRYFFRVLPR